MNTFSVNSLVKMAIVAAIYVIVTLMITPFAYGLVQFRISEVLVLLCFFNPRYIFAITIGTLLANFFGSTLGLIDVFAGSFATLLSVTLIHYTRIYIGETTTGLVVSAVWPILINGIIIGWMLNYVLELPFLISTLSVAAGETLVMALAISLFQLFGKNKKFMEMIKG